jgi:hypothetical protein
MDDEVLRQQLEVRWYARGNNVISGWSVMDCDLPMDEAVRLRDAHGGAHPEVAGFLCEIHARYIADLHNERLKKIGAMSGAPCPACGRPTALTRHGKIYTHRGPAQYPGQLHRPVCLGSGRVAGQSDD